MSYPARDSDISRLLNDTCGSPENAGQGHSKSGGARQMLRSFRVIQGHGISRLVKVRRDSPQSASQGHSRS